MKLVIEELIEYHKIKERQPLLCIKCKSNYKHKKCFNYCCRKCCKGCNIHL